MSGEGLVVPDGAVAERVAAFESAVDDSLPGDGVEPPFLLLRAFDALNFGILVISHKGRVRYYNAAYARLRNIPPGEMMFRPFDELERRRDILGLLHPEAIPPARHGQPEFRENGESLIPVYEGKKLLGIVVIVMPPSEAAPQLPGNAENGGAAWCSRYTFADIVGDSAAMVRARELALRAACGGSSVLLVGESGTGKELFAHAIHAASPRRSCPFVPVDCSAIPRELLEAELFGYAPGAFTGATKAGKPGKFELAHGGTLLLDEIGEMPLEMQAKLLRVLEDRRVTRVGGVAPTPAACTVIAATNRDLEDLVAHGQFRRDLLYRLDVVRIEVPPLRERPVDIPILVEHYWRQKSLELRKSAILSAQILRVLEGYSWPGNVRELVNVVERMLVSTSKRVIELQDLPPQLRQGAVNRSVPFPALHLQTVVAEAERRTLARALQHAHGNRKKAAELVGLGRASFYRKLKAYGFTQGSSD
jgi:transcriptional regulator with PAS, ATPase and Fis domain